MNRDANQISLSIVNTFVSRARGLRFESWAGQIAHSVATVATLL